VPRELLHDRRFDTVSDPIRDAGVTGAVRHEAVDALFAQTVAESAVDLPLDASAFAGVSLAS
jgi:hypothetical protein